MDFPQQPSQPPFSSGFLLPPNFNGSTTIPQISTESNFMRLSPHTIKTLELPELMKNPHVFQMYQKLNDVTTQVVEVAKTQNLLYSENKQLLEEVQSLRAEAHARSSGYSTLSIAPSDSASCRATTPQSESVTMRVVSEGDGPLTRPASYPVKILWTLQDCKNDEDVAITKVNPSRPSIQRAIHNKDGTMITEEDYRMILATARLCRAELLQLPPPPGYAYRDRSLARTKNYFKSYHLKEWAAALQKMEEQQPLLSLCAYYWKADHVLGGLFRSSSHRGMDSSEDDNDDSADNRSASTWLSTKRPRVPSSATNGAKKMKPRTSTSNPLPVHHTTVADEPIVTNQALSMAVHDPPGSLTTPANVPLTITASDTLAISASDTLAISASDALMMTASDTHMTISNNPLALATTTKPVLQPSDSLRRPLLSSLFAPLPYVHSSAAIKSIDFAFIQVDPTLENLTMILAAEFPHFINGLELLNAVKLSPTFGIGAPSPQVLAFIERVECADPNTPDLSPDDTGTS
ncbi:hypothetical protein AcV7_001721 [Taiwanofungus camphoratus]|nr:hypothetical protein AcV7_001721 [Antrodia cinnamomea]